MKMTFSGIFALQISNKLLKYIQKIMIFFKCSQLRGDWTEKLLCHLSIVMPCIYIYIYIYKRACLAANDKAQVCLLQCQFLCEKSSLCQPY